MLNSKNRTKRNGLSVAENLRRHQSARMNELQAQSFNGTTTENPDGDGANSDLVNHFNFIILVFENSENENF